MRNNIAARQTGFTLVEIAIVLVVIGLMMGGVLKGQSMIENAKIKALQTEFSSVQTMLYSYQDKFKALPGDDSAATNHLTGATQASGAGTGMIDTGTWVGAAAPDAGNKSSLFWQHIRLAGLATGAATSGEANNAVGGKLGITSNQMHVTTPTTSGGSFTVCSSAIPGKIAKALDIAMDDGMPNTGSMFSASESGGGAIVSEKAPATAFADKELHTVCMAI